MSPAPLLLPDGRMQHRCRRRATIEVLVRSAAPVNSGETFRYSDEINGGYRQLLPQQNSPHQEAAMAKLIRHALLQLAI